MPGGLIAGIFRAGRCPGAALLRVLALLPAFGAGSGVRAQEARRLPAETPGLARAVQVGDVPLAYTTMILGWNPAGTIAGDAATQTRQALRNADRALAAAGSSLDRAVKVNFYLTREEDAAAVDAVLAETFADRPTAASWVTTPLIDPVARVGVDVIAVAAGGGAGVQVASVRTLPATLTGAHVAVLPAGPKIFVSGQPSAAADLRVAVRKSMASLGRTLEWLQATRADVVQVKAFIRPFTDYRAALEEMAAFFAGDPVPAFVVVEWVHASLSTEIEMLVAGRPDRAPTDEGIAFLTPPGMTASPGFARVVAVDSGNPLIFISGLYGRGGDGGARAEWLDIFTELGDILWATGSSMRHQVKGTYYATTAEARRLHGAIRRVYFDPARPPANSGMMTKGVGRPDRMTTIDMIAIPIPSTRPAR